MITPEEVLQLLEDHTNVLLYGPPGTGKSHLMRQVENLFMRKHGASSAAGNIEIDTTKEREAIGEAVVSASHSRWVTFHQGYSYEDFIIGLRPTPKTGEANGGSILSLEAKAGALLEVAAKASKGHGLLLIDEVNRGNASRIFGEFITLLEVDKRLASDGTETETTLTITLPYLSQGQQITLADGSEIRREFQMPHHVYTLASMNSVDKSVAPIDSAIRRRFYLCQLRPTDKDWETAAGVVGAKNTVASVAVAVMKKINRGIGLHLGPDYMFGQYYFPSRPTLGEMDEAEARVRFVGVWRHKILPQLLEFFHSRPAICMAILEVENLGDNSGMETVEPTDREFDLGASAYVVNSEAAKTDESIFSYLEKFAAGGLVAP